MMFHSIRRPDVLSVTLAAAGTLMVTMGTPRPPHSDVVCRAL